MERPFWLIAASKEGSVNKSGKLYANERGALRGTCHFDIIGSGPGGEGYGKEGRKIFIVVGRWTVGASCVWLACST